MTDTVRFFIVAMRHRRQELSWSQLELSRQSGISSVTINQLENYKRLDPELSSLEKIATSMHYTVEGLVQLGREMDESKVQEIRIHVASQIKDLRELRQLSKNALATRAKISPTHLANIESGETSPTVDMLCRLATGLGIQVIDLFSENEDRPQAD